MEEKSVETKNGYSLDEVVSALQKTIRRGQEFEAMYWATELIESGYDQYLWRRLCVIAAEDIGLADQDVIILVNACANIWERMKTQNKLPEKNIPALVILRLCRSKKNREADDLAYLIDLKRKEGLKLQIPGVAIDCHTKRGRERLHEKADKTRIDYDNLANEEFYYTGANLNKPVTIENNKWARELMKKLGLNYSKYYEGENSKSPIAGISWLEKAFVDAERSLYEYAKNSLGSKELELLKHGITSGLFKFDGNKIEIEKAKKEWSLLAINREYLTQIAYYVELLTRYGYPEEKCKLEYSEIDIAVLDERNRPLIFVETKCKKKGGEKLIEGIRKYSSEVPVTKERGNDALSKAQAILRKKPKYFCIAVPTSKWSFALSHTQKGFTMKEIQDIPKFTQVKDEIG